MSLDINGYSDTFRAFTDFAKVMTGVKGGMNSIARVDAAISAKRADIDQAMNVAKDSASVVFNHIPKSRSAEVARIVDKTEHWRGILNAFQVAERERGETAAEEVLLDAIHGGNGGFMRV